MWFKNKRVIKILTIFFLLLSFVIKSQDEIITKEYQYDPDPALKIKSLKKDTIEYISKGKLEKIASDKVVAVRLNYLERRSKYIYIKASDERIYGIRAGNAFYKADYRFSTDIQPELAKLYFMEKFRVYDSIIYENVTRQAYILNRETKEKNKLPPIKGFFIIFKDDQLHREIKANIYYTGTDSTQLIIKAAISGDSYIYSVNEKNIESIGIQSDGALAGRIALGAVSRGAAGQFYENRWLTKFNFPLWCLSW
jgi:hypothetical protein